MLTKTTAAIAAILTTLGITMIGMATVPYSQTAVADKGGVPNDNANPVAQEATQNEEFFQACKETTSASECAHQPNQGGKYISDHAHTVNGP
jgi:hypothetical protein